MRDCMVTVLMKDGNRTVNWDFPKELSLLDAMKRWHFRWVADSVRVCGMPILDSMLKETIGHFVYVATATARYTGTLWVTMEGVPEEPEKKKKEVKSDVC